MKTLLDSTPPSSQRCLLHCWEFCKQWSHTAGQTFNSSTPSIFFLHYVVKKKERKKKGKKKKKEFPYHTAYMPISINQWMADIYISQEEKGKNRSYTLFLHIFINHISAFWVPSVYKAIMMQTSMFLERQMWSLWLKASTTLICHSCAYNKKNTKNKRPVNKCSELWKSMCTTKEFSFVESFYIFNIILQKVMSPLFVIKQWTAS